MFEISGNMVKILSSIQRFAEVKHSKYTILLFTVKGIKLDGTCSISAKVHKYEVNNV